MASVADLNALTARVTALETGNGTLESSIDTMWVMIAGCLVFFMQAGFALLEAGSVRSKNVKNILLKNLLDACLGGAIFYLFGFGFAFGDGGEFVGDKGFAMKEYQEDPFPYHFWFFQFTFAATTATIVSGAVAERMQLRAYLIISCILTFWIYPVVVHWVWASDGWLAFGGDNSLQDVGVVDFAGSGVVHLTGGTAALWAALILGPRDGKFSTGPEREPRGTPGHSIPLCALGTMILWFGWYGFNCGSTLGFSGDAPAIAGKVAANTTLAPAFAGITALIMGRTLAHIYDPGLAMNAILGGLVGITAGCATVEPWAACVIGILAGIVYYGSSTLVLKLRIDDPLDAASVHGACGILGVLCTGLFSNPDDMKRSYGADEEVVGAFYGGNGKLLANHIAFIFTVIAWVTAWMVPLLFGLKAAGMLRISRDEEWVGLDLSEHGHFGAYPEFPQSDWTAEGAKDGKLPSEKVADKKTAELEKELYPSDDPSDLKVEHLE
eukprot:GFYU01004198.1.p1 GENE.GFYU01004198.1~~GFYU01004198.1.p1  ORF type:complete len:496 (-),score=129.22 GFYU01004198.1:166-1653(-)